MEDILFAIDLRFADSEGGRAEEVVVDDVGMFWSVALMGSNPKAPWDDMFDTPVTLFNVLNYLEEERGFKVIKVVHSPSGRVVYDYKPRTNTLEDSVEQERKEFEELMKSGSYLFDEAQLD